MTELQNWMRSLNSLLRQHGLDLAFSDEQIRDSEDLEIADIDTPFQQSAEDAFREGYAPEDFLIREYLGIDL